MVANGNRTSFLLAIIVGMMLSGATAFGTDEEKPPSFFKRLGLELGRELSGQTQFNQRPAVGQMLAAPVMIAGPMGEPSEKDRQEFKDRTNAYLASFRPWLVATCQLTPEQQTLFDQESQAALEKIQAEYAKESDNNRQHAAMGDTYPIIFVVKGDRTSKIDKALKAVLDTRVLTEQQKPILEAAIKERQDWQKQQFRTLIIQLLDSQLYFSAAQRKSLEETLIATDKIRHPLYTFQPQSYYLPYESIEVLVPAMFRTEVLEEAQRKRLKDLANDRNDSNMIFQSSSGVEEWEKQIKTAAEKYRKMLLLAAEVRIAWYRRELNLNDNDVRALEIAAKGAAMSAVTTWKEGAEATIEQMLEQAKRFGGNFAFGTQTLNAQQLDRTEIWQEAVDKVAENKASIIEERTGSERKIMAAEVAAILDQELWLLPSQREPLITAMEPTLPAKFSSIQYSEYFRDIVILCHPLVRMEEQQKKQVLSEQQVVVFDLLAEHFRYRAENGYAEFSLRNQGTFHLSLSR